jgi:two-component system copper resistance phosphate regulon response regulator CusR
MVILVVEDEEKIAQFLKRGLVEAGYEVEVQTRGDDAYDSARRKDYDAIVLDVALPGQDGLSVCRALRRDKKATPILMLSALGAVPDRIAGLDSGADDYLTKPFAFEEFLARIRALLRKKDGTFGTVLTCADLSLDLLTRKVERGGRPVELSNKEFSLLEYLLRNQGRVVTRNMIAEHVWNLDFFTSTNVIEVYITYLRKKIDADAPVKLIKTLRGRGYQLGDGE